ncbi:MAG: 1-(5-phosphoribosyl)-5-amino-4-imidazole-carboxylate carboxylase, partial [Prochlorothrix sp.]
MQPAELQHLLNRVARGHLSPEEALIHLKNFTGETVGDFARVDHHRALRTGFPEVIWGQDKTPGQIAQIMYRLSQHQGVVMATRVDPNAFPTIRSQVREARYFPVARICALVPEGGTPGNQGGTIAILTAGTADLPVAEEAAVTAELCGFQVERLWDVGVAGIHGLLSNRAVIDRADVLIVV